MGHDLAHLFEQQLELIAKKKPHHWGCSGLVFAGQTDVRILPLMHGLGSYRSEREVAFQSLGEGVEGHSQGGCGSRRALLRPHEGRAGGDMIAAPRR